MASQNQHIQTVFSKGIFHGLPTFPDVTGKKYSAIVTGANGITGTYIVRALAEAPERWGAIYALSRRPPNDRVADNVKHLSVDFLSSPEDIAKQLKQQISKV
jgi:NAD(P)-dependent dehydrogenase (short-subunit alcohol dehydrogenase family)